MQTLQPLHFSGKVFKYFMCGSGDLLVFFYWQGYFDFFKAYFFHQADLRDRISLLRHYNRERWLFQEEERAEICNQENLSVSPLGGVPAAAGFLGPKGNHSIAPRHRRGHFFTSYHRFRRAHPLEQKVLFQVFQLPHIRWRGTYLQ